MKSKENIILQTLNLSKKFGKKWAVRGINLTVYKGDIFGFLGPNGAGKSTTIRMIIGLIFPTSGDIYINNQNYHHQHPQRRKIIRALVEEPNFYEYLSGLDNLKILARLSGKNVKKETIENSLKKVGLFSRRFDKVGAYSRGMKQRLGIAQALMDKPEFIILDEPTTGLDPHGIKEIRTLIQRLNTTENITFLISSHILQEIEKTCNRMAIVQEGNLLTQGKMNELLKEKSLEEYYISLTRREGVS